MTRVWVLVGVVLCLWGWGCQSGSEPLRGSTNWIEQLILDPTENLLRLTELRTTVQLSSLVPAYEIGTWGVTGQDLVSVENGHLRLEGSEDFVELIQSVDWQAETYDLLAVGFEGSVDPSKRVRLLWAEPGAVFSSARSLSQAVGDDGLFSFDLERHKEWSGRIGSIRLDIPLDSDGSRTISSMKTRRYEYDEVRLSALASVNLKVEVGNDLRSSVVTPPGHPVTWELEQVRAHGELRFSYAVVGQSAPASRLRILGEGQNGIQSTLFEAVVDRKEAVAWQEALVDLADFPAVGRLTLEVSSAREGGEFAGIGVWASPSILQPKEVPGKTNVILISIDTLRADRLSLYGYDVATSLRSTIGREDEV